MYRCTINSDTRRTAIFIVTVVVLFGYSNRVRQGIIYFDKIVHQTLSRNLDPLVNKYIESITEYKLFVNLFKDKVFLKNDPVGKYLNSKLLLVPGYQKSFTLFYIRIHANIFVFTINKCLNIFFFFFIYLKSFFQASVSFPYLKKNFFFF